MDIGFPVPVSSHVGNDCTIGKGQMGSALTGPLQIPSLFDWGTFWVHPLTYFIFPKVPGRTFFPNLLRFITFAVSPLVLTPFVRNQDCTSGQTRCPGRFLAAPCPALPRARYRAAQHVACDRTVWPPMQRLATPAAAGQAVLLWGLRARFWCARSQIRGYMLINNSNTK